MPVRRNIQCQEIKSKIDAARKARNLNGTTPDLARKGVHDGASDISFGLSNDPGRSIAYGEKSAAA
jgi:hypothetical protein